MEHIDTISKKTDIIPINGRDWQIEPSNIPSKSSEYIRMILR